MQRKRNKIVLHPIMAYVLMILCVILLSGFLSLVDLSTNYNLIDAVSGDFDSTNVMVNSLANLSGIKLIFRTAVSNFASFAPLSMLLITLMGIGIMDKSGFLQAFFTLITKKASRYMVTFFLALLTIVGSIIGDISFIVLIPIIALFFKYSKRNPKAGIIMAFAGLACGTGINIFMSSIDTALLEYTRLAATSMYATYSISIFAYFIVMIILTVAMSFLVAHTTENVIIPKLGKYEIEDEEEFYLDKKKKKGLIFSLVIGAVYLFIFIYNIIPGLPFSGNLLDYSQHYYIDKLFGYNSFFNQGFVFVITLFFFLCGLFYGLGAKTIKNNQDVSSFLSHSLDGIGKALILIFFSSALIAIFKESNIGVVITAFGANFITNSSFTGIPLILATFAIVVIVTLFVPSPVTSWTILSGSLVPVFMNAGMSAEFAELVFRGAASISYGITPLMAYFVIYLSFMDKYSEEDKPISLFGSVKLILPYVIRAAIIWLAILILFYVLGIPLGIGATAVL